MRVLLVANQTLGGAELAAHLSELQASEPDLSIHLLVPAAVIGVIFGFQYFTQAYVAGAGAGGTLGYPQNSTLFYGIYLYQQGFSSLHFGYASAMAWVLFLIIMVCTVVLIKTSNRWVFYQGGPR